MLAFQFVDHKYQSMEISDHMDFSGWPDITEFEIPGCHLASNKLHGRGLVVIPYIENLNWECVVTHCNILMMEVNEEDIIFAMANGSMRVSKVKILREATKDEAQFIVVQGMKNPIGAYKLACGYFNGASDDTRAVACNTPRYAYEYAYDVDQKPRDDTRQASCGEAVYAYEYANHIDKCPHDDTRKAASVDSAHAFYYAQNIDRCAHEVTRSGAYQSKYWKSMYTSIFGE